VIGTELPNLSFRRIAEVFGAKGVKAEPTDPREAVQSALEARRPTVIKVPIPTLPPPFQIPPATV